MSDNVVFENETLLLLVAKSVRYFLYQRYFFKFPKELPKLFVANYFNKFV